MDLGGSPLVPVVWWCRFCSLEPPASNRLSRSCIPREILRDITPSLSMSLKPPKAADDGERRRRRRGRRRTTTKNDDGATPPRARPVTAPGSEEGADGGEEDDASDGGDDDDGSTTATLPPWLKQEVTIQIMEDDPRVVKEGFELVDADPNTVMRWRRLRLYNKQHDYDDDDDHDSRLWLRVRRLRKFMALWGNLGQ